MDSTAPSTDVDSGTSAIEVTKQLIVTKERCNLIEAYSKQLEDELFALAGQCPETISLDYWMTRVDNLKKQLAVEKNDHQNEVEEIQKKYSQEIDSLVTALEQNKQELNDLKLEFTKLKNSNNNTEILPNQNTNNLNQNSQEPNQLEKLENMVLELSNEIKKINNPKTFMSSKDILERFEVYFKDLSECYLMQNQHLQIFVKEINRTISQTIEKIMSTTTSQATKSQELFLHNTETLKSISSKTAETFDSFMDIKDILRLIAEGQRSLFESMRALNQSINNSVGNNSEEVNFYKDKYLKNSIDLEAYQKKAQKYSKQLSLLRTRYNHIPVSMKKEYKKFLKEAVRFYLTSKHIHDENCMPDDE